MTGNISQNTEAPKPRGGRHDSYERARKLAQEKVRGMNFVEQARAAGAEIAESHPPDRFAARLKFMGQDYLVEYPSGLVTVEGSGKEPKPYDRLIILHYLQSAKGAAMTGEYISYQQIPDAWLYYPSFRRRTTQILARTFGADADGFMEAGLLIGAGQSQLGQYAIEVPALPRVSCHFIMWPGDDGPDTEFNCVFDRAVSDYLPAEDVTALANVITSRLAESAKKGTGK